MARLPRLDLPGVAQHVIQRGNNRLPCMVADPTEYAWSSCAAHCGRGWDSILAPHPVYAALGNNEAERAGAWRDLLREAISDEELAEIRRYLQQQRALGSDRFQAMVEVKTRRFAGVRAAHRPPRENLGQK